MASNRIQLSHFSLNEKLKVLNHEQIRWFYAARWRGHTLPPARRSANFAATRNVFCSLLIKFNCNSSLCTRHVLRTTQKSRMCAEPSLCAAKKQRKDKRRWNRYFELSQTTNTLGARSLLQHHRMNCKNINVALWTVLLSLSHSTRILHIHPKACGCESVHFKSKEHPMKPKLLVMFRSRQMRRSTATSFPFTVYLFAFCRRLCVCACGMCLWRFYVHVMK